MEAGVSFQSFSRRPFKRTEMEIDLSRLPAAVQKAMDRIFRQDADLKVLKAVERQTRLAREARRRPHRWQDDLGPQRLMLDPLVDAYWTAQYGHNWLENQSLVRFLMRRNPEIVGQNESRKIQVGYGGRGKIKWDRGTMEFAR
jgi:hypothetical protein